MKKKIGVLIIIILIVIVSFITVLPIKNEKIIILKGNIFWGEERTCNRIEFTTSDIVNKKCVLCNNRFSSSSSVKLCSSCNNITNRCDVCGKIKTIDINVF